MLWEELESYNFRIFPLHNFDNFICTGFSLKDEIFCFSQNYHNNLLSIICCLSLTFLSYLEKNMNIMNKYLINFIEQI